MTQITPDELLRRYALKQIEIEMLKDQMREHQCRVCTRPCCNMPEDEDAESE